MLTAAIEELQRLDPRPCSRPELVDTIAALDHLIGQAEERRLACLAAIDALGDRGADAATVGRSLSRRSDRRAKKDAEVASRIAEMPVVAGKLAAGEITTEHATACADAAARVTNEEADSLAEMAAAMPARTSLTRSMASFTRIAVMLGYAVVKSRKIAASASSSA